MANLYAAGGYLKPVSGGSIESAQPGGSAGFSNSGRWCPASRTACGRAAAGGRSHREARVAGDSWGRCFPRRGSAARRGDRVRACGAGERVFPDGVSTAVPKRARRPAWRSRWLSWECSGGGHSLRRFGQRAAPAHPLVAICCGRAFGRRTCRLQRAAPARREPR